MKRLYVTPDIRNVVALSVELERKTMIEMGYKAPDNAGGTFTDEVLPLFERLKSDEADLNDQEIQLLQYLLLELRSYLEGRVRLPLVPAEYTKRVQGQLECVNSLLDFLS